jgi:DNA-binding response OmpR family regulator
VLVVEDDPALATMLGWELEESGVGTVVARSCTEARRLAGGMAFALLVVDADLPDGDGVRLAEDLARACPGTGVALCSGRHGIADRLSREGGAPPWLRAAFVKPVPVQRLLDLLAGAAGPPAPA